MTLAARIGGAILLFVALCALTPGMTRAASPTTPTAEAKHCVVVIAPRTAADRAAHRSSQVKQQGCFATKEEKDIALATWAGPAGTQSQYLLIRFWRDVNQGGGGPLEIFSDTGCAGDYGTDYLGDCRGLRNRLLRRLWMERHRQLCGALLRAHNELVGERLPDRCLTIHGLLHLEPRRIE